jgi:hypothetical protein
MRGSKQVTGSSFPRGADLAKASLGFALGLAGSACAITLLFLAMRSVMEIGGSCASGGPYEVANPCPKGVGWIVPASIFGGLFFVGVAIAYGSRLGGDYATLGAFAWPALFLTLGWNFVEYGADPPGADDGPVVSWLFCAALFAVMGGLPLIGLLRPTTLRKMLWPPDSDFVRRPDARLRDARRDLTPSADIVDDLERLARLHREGALDADEYERAKERLLGGAEA